jgi:hypothetical protein
MTKVETQTALENYELVIALKKRKEENKEYEDNTAIEAIDRLIEQLEGTPSYSVLIEE